MVHINNIFILLLLTIIIYLYCQSRALSKYKKREEYIKSALENIPIGICIKDLKGNCILSNKEFANIAGLPEKKITGKNIKEFFTEENLRNINQKDNEVINKKQSIVYENILSSQNKDTQHTYETVKSPILNNKQNVESLMVILKNIDREKELEQKKESFIATLIHDLKSPTSSQINMLNLLLSENPGQLNSQQKEMVELTCNSSRYMSDLIGTILTTYSSDCCELKLRLQHFDIVEIIQSLCHSNNYIAKEREQQIVFNHENKPCIIYGDKLQIKRVISNLMTNALTYGFVKSTIKIDLVKTNNSIEFSVTNQSMQIPGSDLKKLFKRFTKTKMSHFNKVSTSLGLYISKQIIDLHNGKIYAKSFQDGTCIFGFSLAIKDGDETQEKHLVIKN